MAARSCALCLFAASLLICRAADSRGKAAPKGFLTRVAAEEELIIALQQAVGGIHSRDVMKLAQIATRLQPSFNALPKNRFNRISGSAVRYLVHSYFMKVHGWLIRGLEPLTASAARGNTSDDHVLLLKDKVPFIVQAVLKSQKSNGFDLSHAVMMVSLLEHLILNEGLESLEAAYAVNDLSTEGSLESEDVDKVLRSYLVIFAIGNRRQNKRNATQHHNDLKVIKEVWPAWGTREAIATDIPRNLAFAHAHQQNLFTRGVFSFQDATDSMKILSQQFGQIHDRECRELKDGLLELDHSATGRVSLRDFWAKGRIGYWHLKESVEYLRQLGALDESSPKGWPRVIIPNYVTAVSNCDAYSEYFSICCIQECDDILGHLEADIQGPSAPVEQILGLVGNMSSATVDAPRALAPELIDALNQVSTFHEGRVPLHGRLFAQWLHYAFPRECPYPHMSESHNPLTPSQWQKLGGGAVTVTDEDKEGYEKTWQAGIDEDMAAAMSMWTLEEEMRTGEKTDGSGRHAIGVLAGVAQVAAAALILFGLGRSAIGAAYAWNGGSQKPFCMSTVSKKYTV